MKAILEFNLPEDEEEYEITSKATNMSSALFEIKQEIFRPARKHGYSDPEITKLLAKINSREAEEGAGEELIGLLETRFYQILNDHDANF